MFAGIKMSNPIQPDPGWINDRAAVKIAQPTPETIRNFLRLLFESARAPTTGDKSTTINRDIEIPADHNASPFDFAASVKSPTAMALK